MRIFIFALLLAISYAQTAPNFDDYVVQYGKTYDDDEYEYRRNIYDQNVAKITSLNNQAQAAGHTHTHGVNVFTDQTRDEYMAKASPRYNGRTETRSKATVPHHHTNEAAESIDWRAQGAVTQVKNQRICGDCYTFSSTGAIEGANFIKNGLLLSLSEQQLTSCGKITGSDNGCNGGDMDYVFEYVKKNGGITTEVDYPFMDFPYPCDTVKESHHIVEVKGVRYVPPNNMTQLKRAVSIGPVSIYLNASGFETYTSGIYNDADSCSGQTDHAVLVVGYGTENGQDYWIIKNSWGPFWGEDGYIRMEMTGDGTSGMCNMYGLPVYPIIGDMNCAEYESDYPDICTLNYGYAVPDEISILFLPVSPASDAVGGMMEGSECTYTVASRRDCQTAAVSIGADGYFYNENQSDGNCQYGGCSTVYTSNEDWIQYYRPEDNIDVGVQEGQTPTCANGDKATCIYHGGCTTQNDAWSCDGTTYFCSHNTGDCPLEFTCNQDSDCPRNLYDCVQDDNDAIGRCTVLTTTQDPEVTTTASDTDDDEIAISASVAKNSESEVAKMINENNRLKRANEALKKALKTLNN